MKTHKLQPFAFLLIGVSLLVLLGLGNTSLSAAQLPATPTLPGEPVGDASLQADARSILGPSTTLLSYQGQLLDANGDPIDGSIEMSFSFYTQETEGTPFWTETHSDTQAVEVVDGLFHVLLGSITLIDPLDLQGDVYLELTVGGEVLLPRELLTSVIHAVEAATVPDGSITPQKLNLNADVDVQGHRLLNVTRIGYDGGYVYPQFNHNLRLTSPEGVVAFIDADNDHVSGLIT